MKNQGREHVAFAASVEPGNAVVSLRWPSAPRRLSPGLGDYACETVASADRIAIDRLRTSFSRWPLMCVGEDWAWCVPALALLVRGGRRDGWPRRTTVTAADDRG